MKKTNNQKTAIQMNEDIQKKNDEFIRMSKAQKRIAIAKDVLVQLDAEKMKAGDTYCEIQFESLKSEEFGLKEYVSKKVELQTLLPKVKKCKVCAIGSMFISKVALGNQCKVDVEDYFGEGKAIVDSNLNDDDMIIRNLKGIFTKTELRYIEYAYEGRDVDGSFTSRSENFHDTVEKFYKSFRSRTFRLRAIMENIIKNEGTFKL